jgi:hypothetical protein
MRTLILTLALVMPAAWAQEKPAAAKEAAKPAPAQVAEKPAAAKKSQSRRSEDARHCLEKASNNEVIKCAEVYL